MGWFSKKRDPITEKARALETEIEALEAEIKKLSEEATRPQQPRFRSSAVPGRSYPSSSVSTETAIHNPQPTTRFDEVDQRALKAPTPSVPDEHYNELGLRKYDVTAAVKRLKAHFKGPAASNPKLVNYLAAGSIQGLRPLRYEKRVARNRFIFLVIVLVLLLWGILAVILRRTGG
jgi:cell division protein FtsB